MVSKLFQSASNMITEVMDNVSTPFHLAVQHKVVSLTETSENLAGHGYFVCIAIFALNGFLWAAECNLSKNSV